MAEFGVSKFRLGGITPFSSASTTLMTLAIPLVDSKCPTLVLSDPTSTGCSTGLVLPKTFAMASASIGSPVKVPAFVSELMTIGPSELTSHMGFNVWGLRGVKARTPITGANECLLCCGRW